MIFLATKLYNIPDANSIALRRIRKGSEYFKARLNEIDDSSTSNVSNVNGHKATCEFL